MVGLRHCTAFDFNFIVFRLFQAFLGSPLNTTGSVYIMLDIFPNTSLLLCPIVSALSSWLCIPLWRSPYSCALSYLKENVSLSSWKKTLRLNVWHVLQIFTSRCKQMYNRVGTRNSILVTYRWPVNKHEYHNEVVSHHYAPPQDQTHLAFTSPGILGQLKWRGGN